jgi:hypothetical protein
MLPNVAIVNSSVQREVLGQPTVQHQNQQERRDPVSMTSFLPRW